MKFEFRRANLKDLKTIDKIYVEGVVDEVKIQFPERTRSSISNEMNKFRKERLTGWGKDLKSGKQIWLVAEVNNKIIGFANAEFEDKKEGWLRMLYIDRKFRRRGVGNKLTEERLNWLKKNGVKKVRAGMFFKNSKSIKNLKKFGFVKEGPVSISMTKELN